MGGGGGRERGRGEGAPASRTHAIEYVVEAQLRAGRAPSRALLPRPGQWTSGRRAARTNMTPINYYRGNYHRCARYICIPKVKSQSHRRATAQNLLHVHTH